MRSITEFYHPALSENRTLVIITIMLVAILEVLDTTIVNVALPHMMPALGANTEEITWVLTSYIVGSAMMLPLTGFISNRIGHRRLLIINILGFLVTSFLCGTTNSLYEMIFFRLLQGGFGAALIPLSQAILRENFPLEEQGKAMAIWGLGIMAAPVFGPALGGIIVEHSNWRWIFYINGPFCLIGLVLTMFVIKPSKRRESKTDWFGICLMFAGIGALQLFLDQGNSKDWLNSNFIIVLLVTSLIALAAFIKRSLQHKNPVITLAICKDRNFSISTIILALFCASVFSLITLQPILLQTLHHYTAIDSGLTTMPMGIASALGMVLSSMLMNRINVKYLLCIGLLSSAFGVFYLANLDLFAAQNNFLFANGFVGFGMGLFMVPLSTYSLATVANKDITEASGLFSYGRMLGTSIGISIFSTLLTRMTQVNWNDLGANLTPFSPNLHSWLQGQHSSLQNLQTVSNLQTTLGQQAQMIAFNDCFFMIAITLLALIPCVFIMKNIKLTGKTPKAH